MSRGRRHVAGALAAVLLAVAVSGCATSRNFRKRRGAGAAPATGTRRSPTTPRPLQDDPDRPDYKISLERAMAGGVNAHLDKARELDRKGDVENALVEYRKVLEFAPGNSHAITRRGELERQLREKAEAARHADQDRHDARAGAAARPKAPILNPTSKAPLEPELRHQHRDPGHPQVHRRRHRHQRHHRAGRPVGGHAADDAQRLGRHPGAGR